MKQKCLPFGLTEYKFGTLWNFWYRTRYVKLIKKLKNNYSNLVDIEFSNSPWKINASKIINLYQNRFFCTFGFKNKEALCESVPSFSFLM